MSSKPKRKMKDSEIIAEVLAYKPYDPSNLYLWSPLPQDAYFGPKGQNKWIADLDIPRWNLVWVLLDKDPRKAKIKNHEALLERVEKDIRCVGIYKHGGERRTVYEILCEEPNQAQMDMEQTYEWVGEAPSFFRGSWCDLSWPGYPTGRPQRIDKSKHFLNYPDTYVAPAQDKAQSASDALFERLMQRKG